MLFSGLKGFLFLASFLASLDQAFSENLVKTSTTVVVNQFRSSGGIPYAETTLTTSQISTVADGNETTCHTENVQNIVVVEAKKKMILKIGFEKICSRVAEITVQGEFFPLKQTSDVVMVLCNGLVSTTHGCTSQLLNSSCGSITCRQTLTFTCAKPQKKVRRLEVRMYFSQLKKIADIKLCEITVAPFPTSKSTIPPFSTSKSTSPPSSAVATTFGQTTVEPTSTLTATPAAFVPTKNQCLAARWKYISSPRNCSFLTSCGAKTINRTLVCSLSSSEDQNLENSQCCDSISKPALEYDECLFSCWMSWSEWSTCSGTCACGTRVKRGECIQHDKHSGEKKSVDIKECRSAGVVNAVSEREDNCPLETPCHTSDNLWFYCSWYHRQNWTVPNNASTCLGYSDQATTTSVETEKSTSLLVVTILQGIIISLMIIGIIVRDNHFKKNYVKKSSVSSDALPHECRIYDSPCSVPTLTEMTRITESRAYHTPNDVFEGTHS